MRFACWINNATDTHLEYVILITFPQQTRFRKRAYYVYKFIACPVYCRWTEDTSRLGYGGMLIGK